MEVILTKGSGFSWCSENGVYFRGYFEIDGKLYKETALQLLENVGTIKELVSLLEKAYGCFSLIIDKESLKCAAVDVSRSLPLFYSNDGRIVSDSAEAIRKRLSINRDQVDDFLMTAMTAMSFLIGNDTVYSDIKQLDMGQFVLLDDNRPVPKNYFYHINAVSDRPLPEIKKELTQVAYNTFERIKKAIDGRPVVLSMSGGYDSRFVACMLKNVGVTDISGYSYGKAGVFEAEQAKKNAEALGIRWTFVEYNDEVVKKCVDEEGLKYLDSYTGHDYSAYIQNYPAVRVLQEKGWFKPNSVFLTGLCGDMPTGEYVVAEDANMVYNTDTAAKHLYKLLFSRYSMNDDYRVRFIQKLKGMLESLPLKITDYQSWISATDAIYTGTSHVHAFMHMNHVHDFFGYEWLLPYWDKDLLKIWYSIPAKYRVKQELYADWLLNDICKDYGLNTRKTDIGYSPNKLKRKITYIGGTILSFLCLTTGHAFRRGFDFHNWASLELELYKRIENKRAIDYGKASMTNLMVRFCFQRRYGIETLVKAHNNLKVPNF